MNCYGQTNSTLAASSFRTSNVKWLSVNRNKHLIYLEELIDFILLRYKPECMRRRQHSRYREGSWARDTVTQLTLHILKKFLTLMAFGAWSIWITSMRFSILITFRVSREWRTNSRFTDLMEATSRATSACDRDGTRVIWVIWEICSYETIQGDTEYRLILFCKCNMLCG